MKILYIVERWPELSQTFVIEEVNALIEIGCHVEVVCVATGSGSALSIPSASFGDFGPAARLTAGLRQFATAPGSSLTQLTSEPFWPPPNGRRKLRGLMRLAPFRDAARSADHIHAHFATEAADIARLLGSSTGTTWSFTAHGVDAYGDKEHLRTNLRSASFARAASPHVAERLRSADPIAQIIEIPVAVALDRFHRAGPYKPDGPIVSTGRLIEKKGFDDLINAFGTARLGDRELLIIGDGPLRSELEGRAEGLNVRFLGALKPDDVADVLREGSAFALLSKLAGDGDRDGRPAALVEAMAASLPIVSTTMPGIEDLIHPDCGILVDPESAVQAAVALRELMDLPVGARESMGAAGLARSAPFSPNAVAAQLLKLFENAS